MKRELFGNTNLENCEEVNYHYDMIRIFTLRIYNNYSLSMEQNIMCTDICINYDYADGNRSMAKVVFKNGPLNTEITMYNIHKLHIDEEKDAIIIKYKGEN